jgi:hypothetical protein
VLAYLLMDRLYEAHPDAWINHGLRTDEGGRWWHRYRDPAPERNVHNRPPAEWAAYFLAPGVDRGRAANRVWNQLFALDGHQGAEHRYRTASGGGVPAPRPLLRPRSRPAARGPLTAAPVCRAGGVFVPRNCTASCTTRPAPPRSGPVPCSNTPATATSPTAVTPPATGTPPPTVPSRTRPWPSSSRTPRPHPSRPTPSTRPSRRPEARTISPSTGPGSPTSTTPTPGTFPSRSPVCPGGAAVPSRPCITPRSTSRSRPR